MDLDDLGDMSGKPWHFPKFGWRQKLRWPLLFSIFVCTISILVLDFSIQSEGGDNGFIFIFVIANLFASIPFIVPTNGTFVLLARLVVFIDGLLLGLISAVFGACAGISIGASSGGHSSDYSAIFVLGLATGLLVALLSILAEPPPEPPAPGEDSQG